MLQNYKFYFEKQYFSSAFLIMGIIFFLLTTISSNSTLTLTEKGCHFLER